RARWLISLSAPSAPVDAWISEDANRTGSFSSNSGGFDPKKYNGIPTMDAPAATVMKRRTRVHLGILPESAKDGAAAQATRSKLHGADTRAPRVAQELGWFWA